MSSSALYVSDVISREELEYAIQQNLFEPFAQKQYCLLTNQVVGLEVLCRWHRESNEWISPDVFIPLVDEFGLDQEFNTWLFHQSFMQLRDKCAHILNQPDSLENKVSISFNLSAKHLRNLGTFQALINACRYFEVSPRNIKIEVTEDAVIKDISHCHEVLKLLQEMGVHISLDDFGKGYSMFQQLMSFPFNSIKLDKCFAQSIDSDERVLFMLESLALLAKRTNMDVTLEGIETFEQHQLIKRYDIQFAQGYYYHKPESLSTLRI